MGVYLRIVSSDKLMYIIDAYKFLVSIIQKLLMNHFSWAKYNYTLYEAVQHSALLIEEIYVLRGLRK